MYYTAPGQRHVQVLVPAQAPTRALPAPPPQPQAQAQPQKPPPATRSAPEPPPVNPVVREALDAAFGAHGGASPMLARFAPAVRAHIRARKRAAAPAPQPVRVVTCHAREGGEFFGTVETQDGTRRAYAAKICDGKLVAFKVL